MFRPSNPSPRPRHRRGAILVVVLALLALFAVIGISFVFYADSEANAARTHREGQARSEPAPPDAVAVINMAIGSILFDSDDMNNPIRGHSILRDMYGWNSATGTQHTVPFNGVGTFHESFDLTATLGLPPTTIPPYVIPDRARWINYTNIPFPTLAAGPVNVSIDPERTGFSGTPATTARHYIGRNAAYTYPDLKSLYLASVSPATGEVLTKSFHRDWLFNGPLSPNPGNAPTLVGGNANVDLRLAPYDPRLTPGNTDWVSAEGRTKILRPRPVDQLLPAEIVAAGVPYPIPYDIAYNTTNPQYDLYRRSLANLITLKIANGEILPYPPPNADGSYTGDLQNITGGVGNQRNDAILMDFGMQPIKYGSGATAKYVQPLVAITILDHNGRVNLSVAGNVMNGGTTHRSFQGMGPHEINPRRAMDPTMTDNDALTDMQTLTNQRYPSSTIGAPNGAQARGGVRTMFFDPSRLQTPAYSLVNWNTTPTPYVSFTMPNFQPPSLATALRTVPNYTGSGGWDNNLNTSSQANNHPGLFNPEEWPAGPRDPAFNLAGRVYDPLDFRRLAFRYAASPELYSTSDMASYAPFYLKGVSPLTPPPNQLTYRLDKSHAVRFMFTPRSTSLDFPGMMPNFVNVGTNGLGLTVTGVPRGTPPQPTMGVLANTSFTSPMPNPTTSTPGTLSDFRAGTGTTPAHEWRNIRAAIGPVDLNRPLADYRDPSQPVNATALQPLSPASTSQASSLRAWADRHNLARDIFARLIVATGANATVDGNGNVTIPFASPPVSTDANFAQFNALRYLAQVAANIVDYIDPDDVNTPFLWFRSDGGVLRTIQAVDLTYYPYTNILPPGSTLTPPVNSDFATAVGGRAVFGVEKPRLVINEAYSEIVNNPNDRMNTSAEVRVWVELLNPTSPPYTDTTVSGPLGNGSIRLRYEPALDGPTVVPATIVNAYAAYRLAVVRAGKSTSTAPAYTAQDYLNSGQVIDTTTGAAVTVGLDNVTGWVPPLTGPDIDYGFIDTNIANNGVPFVVDPNNGQYLTNGSRAAGMVLVGPRVQGVGGRPPLQHEFNPMGPTGMGGPVPFTNMIVSNLPAGGTPARGESAMAYIPNLPVEADLAGMSRNHIVMLRRLANPYMPPNDPTHVGAFVPGDGVSYPYNPNLPPNPYITIDYMNDVPAHDAVLTPGKALPGDPDPPPRQPRTAPTDSGYLPIQERFAVGKIQPYAGYAPPSQQPEMPAASLPNASFVPAAIAPPPTAFVPGQQFTTMGSPPTYTNNYLGNATFSCVIRQDPNPPAPPDMTTGAFIHPKHTFGRHNARGDGSAAGPIPSINTLSPAASPALNDPNTRTHETIAAPFDWFVHMDRPLTNPLELRWVQAGKPHLVTQMFWQPSAVRGYSAVNPLAGYKPEKEAGLVPWFNPDSGDNSNNQDPTVRYQPPGGTPAPPYAEFAYNRTNNGLFRAFEMLRIKPFMHGTPMGGRVHGRMNLNTMQDYRQLVALLDPPTNMAVGGNGNMFDAYDVYQTNPPVAGFSNFMYNRLVGARTANMVARYQPDGTTVIVPVPGPTYDDVGSLGNGPYAGYAGSLVPFAQVDPRTGLLDRRVRGETPIPFGTLDRPFKSYGTGEFGSTAGLHLFGGGGSTFTDANLPTEFAVFGPGLKDTIMRTIPEPVPFGNRGALNNPNLVLQVPRLWVDQYSANPSVSTANTNYLDRDHPYFRSEAARKLFNNVNTVSNTFSVHMTIVFHEVRTDPVQTWVILTEPTTGRPLLSKEIYKEVPGDLRQQYFFMIDRTNATIAKRVTTITDVNGAVVPGYPQTEYLPGPRPYFTTLEAAPIPADLAAAPARDYTTIQVAAVQDAATNNVVSIMSEGTPVPINVNDALYLGTGSGLEGVRVRRVQSFSNGIATLEVDPLSPVFSPAAPPTPQLSKPHAVGTSVSNVAVGLSDAANVPVSPALPTGPPYAPNTTYIQIGATIGNIGPRTGFQYWNPAYSPVLPYVLRIR